MKLRDFLKKIIWEQFCRVGQSSVNVVTMATTFDWQVFQKSEESCFECSKIINFLQVNGVFHINLIYVSHFLWITFWSILVVL